MYYNAFLVFSFWIATLSAFSQAETNNPVLPFWTVKGNSGTTPGTNFIGTTDAKKLIFKVNNQQAGLIDYTSPYNTTLGYQALVANTTGYSNAAFGYLALAANTTGYDNMAIGDSTLSSNTTGYHNVALGTLALYSNTTGVGNTAIGYAALQDNSGSTSSLNTAVGDYSLTNNTTGFFNTMVGGLSGYRNTTARYNTGIGYRASYTNLTGEGNVAIGHYALNSNLVGRNVAIGTEALADAQLSSQNVAIGYFALHNLSGFPANTVSGNVAVGAYSLYSANYAVATYPIHNTAIGDSSLRLNTFGWGNTALGKNALLFNTGGTKNTAIGYNADVSNSFLTNATAIGYNAKVNQSNAIVLGATGTDQVTVGIGTTTPTYPLTVISTVNGTFGPYGYLTTTGAATFAGSNSIPVSIWASGRVLATEFDAYSDARIKNIINISDGVVDLNTIAQIQITNYQYIDTISKGNRVSKKVIAQQVEGVYPSAVSKITDVIPDIYQLAEMHNGKVKLKNNLQPGEKVKLIFADQSQVYTVLSANEKEFEVNEEKEGSVFVFGREVNDFRVVDYEALAMLNISATQQLLKMIIQQQKDIEKMRAQWSALQNEVEEIKQQLLLKSANTD
ncbi:MAG: tail fiber domain-containing protein [Chitinophagales bacterium]|nr:tail fiber domain-containing protein [Chitinophagales bacterium]